MENTLKQILENVTDLELVIESEPGKKLTLKCELHEVMTDTKVAVSVPIHNGHRYPLDAGKRVMAYLKKPEVGLCSFLGLVVGRTLEGATPLLYIQMVSPVQKTQRREYYRMSMVMNVTLKIQVGVTKEKQVNMGKIVEVEIPTYAEEKVLTKDISGGGLRTLVSKPYPLGTAVMVDIPLENESVTVKAEIVRCGLFSQSPVQYELGIRFLELEERERSRIISFIFDKQRTLRKKGLV